MEETSITNCEANEPHELNENEPVFIHDYKKDMEILT
jgi:hypothetical protein